MECADAKLRMEPYATGNLSSPDREDFEKHIADCEGCRLELDLTRAGVAVRKSDEVPPPGPEFVRSGESGFTPGAAFGASSALDEASFADVASQLSEAPPPPAPEFERSAPALAPRVEEPAREAEPPPVVPPPAAPPPPQTGGQDYSLDALLANATPSPPGGTEPPPARVDPLEHLSPLVPAEAPARATPPAAAGAPAARSNWEFEPAEARRTGAPPEGSLFFAEETLARARGAGARRKGGALKLALWVSGSAVGVALLAFAGWIAFNARPLDEAARLVADRYTVPPRHASTTPPAEAAPEEPTAAAPAAPEELEPAPAPPEEADPATPPQETPEAPPAGPGEAPAVSSASTLTPRSPIPESATPAAPRPATRTRAETPRGSKSPSARGPAPTAEKPSAKKPVRPAPAAPEAGAPAPAPAESERPAPPERDTQPEGSGTEPREPAPAAPERPAAGETPSPGEQPAVAGETPQAGASSPPSPAQPPPEAATAPAPPPPSGPAGEEAPAAPERPIDRLHLATVAAEQRGDLRALRSMRDTWKSFLQKAGVGPDRVRAKRELADCLWAIQAITGRRSDQRDALRAYRDYLLNAPAGGADSRTVGRAKQLQDALSESD